MSEEKTVDKVEDVILELNNLTDKQKHKINYRLKEYRKHYGWSQGDISAKLGISRQAISRWEKHNVLPSHENLIVLCKLYGITMEELVYGEKKTDNVVEVEVRTIDENNTEILPKVNNNNLDISAETTDTNVNEDNEIENSDIRINKIRNIILKLFAVIVILILIGYTISCVNKFFILKEINDKFNQYKDVDNCYVEIREATIDAEGMLNVVNYRYWYKDGILKKETIKTENGNTKIIYKYQDFNKKEKYVFSEKDKNSSQNDENISNNVFDNGIFKYLIGENYYESNFEIIKDALINKITVDKENYIIERNFNDYKKNIYNKENAIIKQSYALDPDGEETNVTYKIEINTVTDEDIRINIEDYNIEEIK